jgi:hypothetical protein
MAIAYRTGDGFSVYSVGGKVTAEFRSNGSSTSMDRAALEKAVKAGGATPEMKKALQEMNWISPPRGPR